MEEELIRLAADIHSGFADSNIASDMSAGWIRDRYHYLRSLALMRGVLICILLALTVAVTLLWTRSRQQVSMQLLNRANIMAERGESSKALAYLATSIRQYPRNQDACWRAQTMLMQRRFIVPAPERSQYQAVENLIQSVVVRPQSIGRLDLRPAASAEITSSDSLSPSVRRAVFSEVASIPWSPEIMEWNSSNLNSNRRWIIANTDAMSYSRMFDRHGSSEIRVFTGRVSEFAETEANVRFKGTNGVVVGAFETSDGVARTEVLSEPGILTKKGGDESLDATEDSRIGNLSFRATNTDPYQVEFEENGKKWRIPSLYPEANIFSFEVSPSGKFIALAMESGSCDLYEIKASNHNQPKYRFFLHPTGTWMVAFSPDERLLAVATGNAAETADRFGVQLFSTSSGERISDMLWFDGTCRGLKILHGSGPSDQLMSQSGCWVAVNAVSSNAIPQLHIFPVGSSTDNWWNWIINPNADFCDLLEAVGGWQVAADGQEQFLPTNVAEATMQRWRETVGLSVTPDIQRLVGWMINTSSDRPVHPWTRATSTERDKVLKIAGHRDILSQGDPPVSKDP